MLPYHYQYIQRTGSTSHRPKRKKGTSGVEMESNDPIKTQNGKRGFAGVVNVF